MIIFSLLLNNLRKNVAFPEEDNITEFFDHLFCEKYQKSTKFEKVSIRKPKKRSKICIKKTEK